MLHVSIIASISIYGSIDGNKKGFMSSAVLFIGFFLYGVRAQAYDLERTDCKYS